MTPPDALEFRLKGMICARIHAGLAVTVQRARILVSSKARAAQKRSIHQLGEHLSSTATPLAGKRRVC